MRMSLPSNSVAILFVPRVNFIFLSILTVRAEFTIFLFTRDNNANLFSL